MPRRSSNSTGGQKTKARKLTGEPRDRQQPLKIDRLPADVREMIHQLYVNQGKTWEEISLLSAEPKDKGGFIDWKNLPIAVLELFPDMRLPTTTLHRWFDLRIKQVSRDVMVRAEQARTIAEAFVKSNVAGGDEAVINAARDTLMGILAEDGSAAGRINATKGLLKLSEVMSRARTNEIRARRVSVDERKIAQLEKDAELRRAHMERETAAATKKISKGEPLTIDDINRIRQSVFGMGPAPVAANG